VPLAEDMYQQDSDDPNVVIESGRSRSAGSREPGVDAERDGEGVVDHSLVVQRLGKVREARQEARRGDPPRDASGRPSVGDIERLPQAPQWKCGEARLKLRQSYNRKEIDVASLMRKFDTNNDWKLEQDEFLSLLQDYNSWNSHINKDEVEMVLQLADLDHDDCIEPNEVLYALRVWYAYVNMPRGTVGQALGALSDCALPPPEVLKEAMLVMNEEHPVDLEEAEYVRHIALALGATEQKVNAHQMRMAISAWYLHIERKETRHGELVKHAIGSTHERLCLQNPIQKCVRGEWDVVTLWLNGMFAVVWILVPLLCIWAGNHVNTEEYPCERPMLSTMIGVTGYVAIIHGAGVFWLTAAWECTTVKKCRLAAGISLLVVSLILVIFWVMGLWQISTTNPSRCGYMIYELGHFVWIGLPALCSVFLFCCIPCIYCHEYFKHKSTDHELMGRGNDSSTE